MSFKLTVSTYCPISNKANPASTGPDKNQVDLYGEYSTSISLNK